MSEVEPAGGDLDSLQPPSGRPPGRRPGATRPPKPHATARAAGCGAAWKATTRPPRLLCRPA